MIIQQPHPEPASCLPNRPHWPALDGVRGIAALVVMIHHFTPDPSEGWVEGLPVVRWLHVGWMGVDLFFVLSGFLITGILLDDLGKPRYFRNFYARRALRIFPLYYGVLLTIFVIFPIGLALSGLGSRANGRVTHYLNLYTELSDKQIWLWLYLSNFAQVFGPMDWRSLGHFWSLAIEEHFYLVWPAVVFLQGRRRLVHVCFAIVTLSLTLRLGIYAYGLNWGASYVLTPCRLDGLAMGGVLAAVSRGTGGLTGLMRWTKTVRWIGVTAAGVVVYGFYRQKTPDHGEFFCTVGFTLLAIVFTTVIAGAITATPNSLLGRVYRSAPLRFLGKYSYGLYVYNRLLVLPIRHIVRPEAIAEATGSPLVGVFAMQVSGVAITICISLASWHLWESQFLKFKRLFA